MCCPVIVHNPVWELHTSAATPPLLFSVALTTNLVGHVLGTSRLLKHVTTLNQVYIFTLCVTGSLCSFAFFFFLFCIMKDFLFVLVGSEPVLGGDSCCVGLGG